jgi:SAM-dependent methyltransferase
MYSDIFNLILNNNKLADYLNVISVDRIDNINYISKLKSDYPDLPVNDLLTLIKLRSRYSDKLKISQKWIITEKNAQQASPFHTAKYNGSLFNKFTSVADLCCGIGMDLFFLSHNKSSVYAVDLDPDILNYAEYNMKTCSKNNISFLNIKAEDFSLDTESVFIDPDRRPDLNKTINPFLMSPNLNQIESLLKKYPNMAVKLSPMLNYDKYDIFNNGSLHFVSENNDLKEILFCTGKLASDSNKICTQADKNIRFDNNVSTTVPVNSINKYLIEPDVSIIKAHLVENFALEINASKIDQYLATLTSESLVIHPFAKYYRVVDILNFSLKDLNLYLKSHNIGYLDIKTRGFSESVESFRKKIKTKGNEKATLFILKIKEKHVFIICNFGSVN